MLTRTQSLIKTFILTLVWAVVAVELGMIIGPRVIGSLGGVGSSLQLKKNLPPLAASTTYDFKKSMVRLYMDGEFVCSGVVIGDNYVLTASHCLVDGNMKMKTAVVTVENDDTKVKVAAKAVGVNLRLDWGLIQGNFAQIPGAYLLSGNLEVPQVVMACGYPQGSHVDHCEFLMPQVNDLFFIKCNGRPLQPGMSGGPVFDKDGIVIGLNVQVYEAAQGGGSAYTPTIGILSAFHIGD